MFSRAGRGGLGGSAGLVGSAGSVPEGASGGSAGMSGLGGSPDASGGGGASSDAGADAPDAALPPSGGFEPDAATDAERPCGGTVSGGICWYLGPLGESCNAVCADRGGFDASAAALIGTPNQSGSLDECSNVLVALLGDAGEEVQLGTQVTNGVGCHVFGEEQERWWLTEPDFDPDASLTDARLACGCNE